MQKKRFSIIPNAERKSIFSVLSLEDKDEKYKEIFWFVGSLVLVGLLYLVLWFWGGQIEKNTQNLAEQKQTLQNDLVISDEQRKELQSFVQRLDSIEILVAETKYPSDFFPELTETLSRFVTLTNLSLDVDGGTVFITAEADKSDTVASQFLYWANQDFIKSVRKASLPEIEEGSESPNTALFSAQLEIKPEFLQPPAPPSPEPEPEQEQDNEPES